VPETVFSWDPPQQTFVAAFYYPWYEWPQGSTNCPLPSWSYWCECFWEPKQTKPRPSIGFYDSDDAAKVNAQLDAYVQHGINVVGIEWDGKELEVDSIEGTLIPAIGTPAHSGLKFVLLYDLGIRFGPDNIDLSNPDTRTRMRNDFEYFAGCQGHVR
jgi:hypothetical protein